MVPGPDEGDGQQRTGHLEVQLVRQGNVTAGEAEGQRDRVPVILRARPEGEAPGNHGKRGDSHEDGRQAGGERVNGSTVCPYAHGHPLMMTT
ncbi:hypothetical protein GCM10009721_26370 [Terrabacter tumescens]|uniref:Uncharacterized protein n=1 Tax=Terrabacter tumescens TaxID=60443 RepID=A0ABQ2I4S9_9MICO|nr:hypothetical protein GCM10009721_26370 [Terrabacter tumescens]